jgi:hypothetical protein
MKRLILLVVAASLAPLASAQLYKYVDKDGKTVYSDQPPANIDSKQLRIQSGTTAPTATAAAPKTALDKDKELEKGRKEARDKDKKAEDAAKSAQADEERCSTARNNYAIYLEGGRITKRDKSGERVFMEDDEIAREKEKARVDMEKYCKKG